MGRKEDTRRAGNFAEEQHDGHKTGEQMQFFALPAQQEDTTDEPTDAQRSQWAHAVSLIDANPAAFAAYAQDVRERVRHNRYWGGSDHMRHFLRDGGFTTAEGDKFKVGHNDTTVWSREVCRRWPDLAPHILPSLRHSPYDYFYRDLFEAEGGSE